METTLCILNPAKAHCRGQPRTNVPGVLCCQHLGNFFGLEMGIITHDTPTAHKAVGPNLKPKPGIIFERNCVLFPEREFFDKTFWSRHAQALTPEESTYHLNPIVKTFVENNMTRDITSDKRFQVEIIRNLSKDPKDMNFGPENVQAYLAQENLTNLKTKAFKSEQFVTKLPYEEYTRSIHVPKTWSDKADEAVDPNRYVKLEDHTSKLLTFILSYCYTSDYKFQTTEIRRPQALMYNVRYVKNVGLVTTEQIAHPMFLVLEGTSTAHKQHVEEAVSTVDKRLLPHDVTRSEIPRSFAVSSVLQGVNPDCYGP